jgi:hypothetical protein
MMSANVQSQTAISDFRAALCTFMVEARQALAAIEMEARRAVEYITETQAQAWQGEVRRGCEKVAQAKLEIHNVRTFKRIGDYIPSCIDEKKELDKAERRLRIAETKVEAARHWGRVVEQAFREFQARLAQFISVLDGDLPKAVATLERILMTLDRYLAVETPMAAAQSVAAESMRRPSVEPEELARAVPTLGDTDDTTSTDVSTENPSDEEVVDTGVGPQDALSPAPEPRDK